MSEYRPESRGDNPTFESLDTGQLSHDSVVNVKNEGANADGATDDTDALDSAHQTAAENGTVYYPRGTYMRDFRNETFPDGQTVILARGATIKANAQEVTEDGVGLLPYKGESGSRYSGVTIKGEGAIDGNKDNITFAGGVDPLDTELLSIKYMDNLSVLGSLTLIDAPSEGVDLDQTADSVISGVRGVQCGGYAVHNSIDCEGNVVRDSVAIECGLDNNRAGFDQYSSAEGCQFYGIRTRDCNKGLFIQGSGAVVEGFTSFGDDSNALRVSGTDHNMRGVNVLSTVPNGNAVTIDGVDDSELTGYYLADANDSGLRILSGSSRNIYQGQTINNGVHGIRTDGSDSIFIGQSYGNSGNNLQDNGTGNDTTLLKT